MVISNLILIFFGLVLIFSYSILAKDLYKVMGVSRYSDVNQIKKAYRSLAMKYHPDKNPEEKRQESTNILGEINEAYEILSDVDKRKQYDLTLNDHDDNSNLLPDPPSQSSKQQQQSYYGAAQLKRNYQQWILSVILSFIILYITITNIIPTLLSSIQLSYQRRKALNAIANDSVEKELLTLLQQQQQSLIASNNHQKGHSQVFKKPTFNLSSLINYENEKQSNIDSLSTPNATLVKNTTAQASVNLTAQASANATATDFVHDKMESVTSSSSSSSLLSSSSSSSSSLLSSSSSSSVITLDPNIPTKMTSETNGMKPKQRKQTKVDLFLPRISNNDSHNSIPDFISSSSSSSSSQYTDTHSSAVALTRSLMDLQNAEYQACVEKDRSNRHKIEFKKTMEALWRLRREEMLARLPAEPSTIDDDKNGIANHMNGNNNNENRSDDDDDDDEYVISIAFRIKFTVNPVNNTSYNTNTNNSSSNISSSNNSSNGGTSSNSSSSTTTTRLQRRFYSSNTILNLLDYCESLSIIPLSASATGRVELVYSFPFTILSRDLCCHSSLNDDNEDNNDNTTTTRCNAVVNASAFDSSTTVSTSSDTIYNNNTQTTINNNNSNSNSNNSDSNNSNSNNSSSNNHSNNNVTGSTTLKEFFGAKIRSAMLIVQVQNDD